MRRISLTVAVGSLIAVALLFASSGSSGSNPTGYETVLGAGVASAQSVLPARPMADPACSRVCLSVNGTKFCGFGSGRIGCKSIVNNNCIYTLCPPPPPIED